jgi:O-antigen ligase|tara:strand:- start:4863 stop:6275 length:1413 start_codon:yes stop_codon:yes gene_type:complete
LKSSSYNNKLTLEKVTALLFFLGVFFIPFSSFEGLSFLGEFKKEASFFFFILVFLLLLINVFFSQKIRIPFKNPLFLLLLAIILWFFVATLLNTHNIIDYNFKYTSGINRFIRQYAVLILSSFVLLLSYYNVMSRYTNVAIFNKIRKIFLASLLMVFAYGFIEILIIKFKINALKSILELFDYFPFTNVYLDPKGERISSVTYEPPALASYLLTISGWMFSYIVTEKGLKRFIPSIMILILALFSGSRAGLVIIITQVIVFILLLFYNKKYHLLLLRLITGFALITLLIGIIKGPEIADYLKEKITSFGINNNTHAVSNKSRFGIQYALFQVFLDHPISGVGYGQQTYEMIKNLPPWSTSNNWEFKIKYLNPEHPAFPPGYNLFVRILAETGIIGFVLFSSWILFILYTCFSLFKLKNKDSIFAMVLFISIIGFIMNWFKTDTIRVFGFWINFALLLILTRKIKYKIDKK